MYYVCCNNWSQITFSNICIEVTSKKYVITRNIKVAKAVRLFISDRGGLSFIFSTLGCGPVGKGLSSSVVPSSFHEKSGMEERIKLGVSAIHK